MVHGKKVLLIILGLFALAGCDDSYPRSSKVVGYYDRGEPGVTMKVLYLTRNAPSAAYAFVGTQELQLDIVVAGTEAGYALTINDTTYRVEDPRASLLITNRDEEIIAFEVHPDAIEELWAIAEAEDTERLSGRLADLIDKHGLADSP